MENVGSIAIDEPDDLVESHTNPTGAKLVKRSKVHRSFPAATFEEALELPLAIQKISPGQKVRRLTLFDHLKKSPDSGHSRQLISNANRYGLTKGSYSAEFLELTPDGNLASSLEVTARQRAAAQFRLGIEHIKPFSELYQQSLGNRLPTSRVLQDLLKDSGYATSELPECVETFIINAKFVGVLRTIAGAERIVPLEQVLESLPGEGGPATSRSGDIELPYAPFRTSIGTAVVSNGHKQDADVWSNMCFYIAPIGEDGSEARQHSDLFLHSIIEPALEELKLNVVRADNIGKPGMINAHIIEHIIRARIVIADLSFHNPNVFYELALRHACRLPTVHVIRKTDRIPFDIEQTRIIKIDDSTIYTLVPQLEVYKAEIANHVRRAINEPDASDNPITTFCPALSVQLPTL